MIIRPPATEADSQLQKQLCRQALRASLAREVQLNWYPMLGLKVLFTGFEGRAARLRRRALRDKGIGESRRWEPLYGILSGPCMI